MMTEAVYESICLQQAEVIEKMSELTKQLISELEQYRAVDKEEKIMEELESILTKGGK